MENGVVFPFLIIAADLGLIKGYAWLAVPRSYCFSQGFLGIIAIVWYN
jgi:hypothetical protein